MTILSDKSIIKLIANKEISIEPFKEANLTPNGYDLTVGEIEIPDEEKISKELDYHYGERVTGKHILNMIQSGSIDNLCVFNFGYRVIR